MVDITCQITSPATIEEKNKLTCFSYINTCNFINNLIKQIFIFTLDIANSKIGLNPPQKHSRGVHCARTKHGKNLANCQGPNRGVGPFEPNVYFDHEISEALMFNMLAQIKLIHKGIDLKLI